MNWADIWNRALWTFAQAAAGFLVVAIGYELTDDVPGVSLGVEVLWGALAAGLAAAFSVGKNVVVQKRAGTP